MFSFLVTLACFFLFFLRAYQICSVHATYPLYIQTEKTGIKAIIIFFLSFTELSPRLIWSISCDVTFGHHYWTSLLDLTFICHFWYWYWYWYPHTSCYIYLYITCLVVIQIQYSPFLLARHIKCRAKPAQLKHFGWSQI